MTKKQIEKRISELEKKAVAKTFLWGDVTLEQLARIVEKQNKTKSPPA